MWKENLFQNLLTFSILAILAITVYCKVTNKTLTEFIVQIREAFATPIEE